MKLIHDIAPTTDNWAKNYAHLEYMRIVDHDLWQATKYIEVNSDVFNCLYCGKEYVGRDPITCSERCNILTDQLVDEERGK